jgi:hypothetical protein
MITLNEKNWIILEAINEEIGVFQDNINANVSAHELKERMKESVRNQRYSTDTYSLGYLDKRDRLDP